MTTVLGLDVGGTKLAAGIGDADGRLLVQRRLPANAGRGPAAVIADLLALARAVLAESPATPDRVGISVGGPLDPERGVLICPPHLPGWIDVPLADIVRRGLGLPVSLENDANAAAVAECRWGAGRGLDHVIYVTVSTGIGAGVVVHRRLLRGVGCGAGEIGHMVVRPGGRACECGNRGCVTAEASGSAIGAKARERLAAGEGRGGALARLAVDFPGGATARQVADTIEADPLAAAVWADAVDALAAGLANVVHVIAPQRIVVGGGVAAAGERLFGPLRRGVAERVHLVPAYAVSIVPSAFGADAAGLQGAVAVGVGGGESAVS